MVAIRKTPFPSADAWGASEVSVKPAPIREAGAAEVDLDSLARPSRRDALPEHTRYVDSGCEVHHSCLSCPLARCRYDEPGGVRRVLGEERDRSILDLRRQGRPISLIAQRFGISRRTVFRVLAAARAGC